MTTPTTATLPLLLKLLALPTFVREYALVAAQATHEGLSYEAYVHALATQELSERPAGPSASSWSPNCRETKVRPPST